MMIKETHAPEMVTQSHATTQLTAVKENYRIFSNLVRTLFTVSEG